MSAKAKKISIHGWIEVIFDSVYLLFVLIAGVFFLAFANGRQTVQIYGALALMLGIGDSFHLLPRMLGHLKGDVDRYTKSLGFGKLVTSITMTGFYLLLYRFWTLQFGNALPIIGIFIYALALVRMGLCCLPGNRWLSADPPLSYGIYRNIPFFAVGALVAYCFYSTAAMGGGFAAMHLAIFLSFLFYAPVVFWAQKWRPIGALMLPKTAVYFWMVWMGFSLL